MSLKGDRMKKSRLSSAMFIALFLLVSNIIRFPNVTAPPPASPDHFIADICPNNNNTNVHLLNVSVNITLNASDRYQEMGISFIGNYSLFNPESLTNLTIFLPFLICLDIERATFGVFVNDSQIPFEINEILWDTVENGTNILGNLDWLSAFPRYFLCPIILITTNLTLMENATYVVTYQFEGSIPNPLWDDVFFVFYTSETAKFWKGNATERVEYNVFGGNPVFRWRGSGLYNNSTKYLEYVEGKKIVCEWINAPGGWIGLGVNFDERNFSFSTPLDIFFTNIPGFIVIIIVIALYVRKRKRKYLRDV